MEIALLLLFIVVAPLFLFKMLKDMKGTIIFRSIFFISIILAYGQFIVVTYELFSAKYGSGIILGLSMLGIPIIMAIGALVGGILQGFVALARRKDCFTPLQDMLLVAVSSQSLFVYFRHPYEKNIYRILLNTSVLDSETKTQSLERYYCLQYKSQTTQDTQDNTLQKSKETEKSTTQIFQNLLESQDSQNNTESEKLLQNVPNHTNVSTSNPPITDQTSDTKLSWIACKSNESLLSPYHKKHIAKLYALYKAEVSRTSANASHCTPLVNLNPHNQELFTFLKDTQNLPINIAQRDTTCKDEYAQDSQNHNNAQKIESQTQEHCTKTTTKPQGDESIDSEFLLPSYSQMYSHTQSFQEGYAISHTLQSSQNEQSFKRGMILLCVVVIPTIAIVMGYKWYRFSPLNPHSLLNAIQDNQTQKALALIQESPHKDEALAYLIKFGNPAKYQLSKALLKAGANPNAQPTEYSQPLIMMAADDCDIRIASLLLEYGANTTAVDKSGEDVLFAIRCGNSESAKELISLLLQYGANPQRKTKEGYTALLKSLMRSSDTVAQALIYAGSDVNAVYTRDNGETTTPLHIAALNNNKETVRLLIQKGATFDVNDTTLLFNALRNNNERGSEDEKEGKGAEILKLLLELGIKTNRHNAQGTYPIHEALYPAQITALVRYGADINARNAEGNTPLLEVVKHNRYMPRILWFLESGADIYSVDTQGQSALELIAALIQEYEQGKLYADTKVIQRIQEILQKHSQGLNTEKESKL